MLYSVTRALTDILNCEIPNWKECQPILNIKIWKCSSNELFRGNLWWTFFLIEYNNKTGMKMLIAIVAALNYRILKSSFICGHLYLMSFPLTIARHLCIPTTQKCITDVQKFQSDFPDAFKGWYFIVCQIKCINSYIFYIIKHLKKIEV